EKACSTVGGDPYAGNAFGTVLCDGRPSTFRRLSLPCFVSQRASIPARPSVHWRSVGAFWLRWAGRVVPGGLPLGRHCRVPARSPDNESGLEPDASSLSARSGASPQTRRGVILCSLSREPRASAFAEALAPGPRLTTDRYRQNMRTTTPCPSSNA